MMDKTTLAFAPGGGDRACTGDSQSQSKTSLDNSRSTMSSSGQTRTAAGKSPRRSRRPPSSKPTAAIETFEDELAAPSSLRKLQDEDAENCGRNGRQNPTKCTKLCHLLAVGVLVQILTISVLLIVYMTLSSKNNDSKSELSMTITTVPPVNYSDTSGETIYLAPPPADIQRFCNMDKMIDPAGHQQCQEICSRANCCVFSYLNDRSCWKDNRDACKAYQEACAVLEPLHHQTTDQRNSNPQDEITVMPNAVDLWDNVELLQPAPEQLPDFCKAAAFWSEDMMNSEEASGAAMTCHEICNSARCCWDRSLTNAADRCWTHPRCYPYEEACNVFSFLQSSEENENDTATHQEDSALHAAPWNITEYCHPDKIQTSLEELLACQAVCLPAECCWNSALMDQCVTSSTDKCDGYKFTCAVLTIPMEPSQSPGTTDPRGDESGLDLTTDYPTTTIVTTIPSYSETPQVYSAETIRDVCLNHDNAINIASGRFTLCEQVCQSGSCCFSQYNSQNGYSFGTSVEDINSCPPYLPNDYCDKFASCQVIFTPALGNTQRVQRACTNLYDLADCVKVCAKATCCFTNNPWRACAATNNGNMICEQYSSCEVLYQGLNSNSDVPQESDRNDDRRNLRAGTPRWD